MKSIAILALLGLIGVEQVTAVQAQAQMNLELMTKEADSVLTQFEDIDSSLPINQLVIVNKQKKNKISPQMAQAHDDSSSESSSDSDDEEPQHVQIRRSREAPIYSLAHNRRVEELDPTFGGFPASLHGFVGNNENGGMWKDAYNRTLPGHLDGEDGTPVDTFTANVIKNYATEGVTKEGLPSGQFFITKD